MRTPAEQTPAELKVQGKGAATFVCTAAAAIAAASLVLLGATAATVSVTPRAMLGLQQSDASSTSSSCKRSPPASLRWSADTTTANAICCHNHLFAEPAGSFELTRFPVAPPTTNLTFYDSVSNIPLYVAPRGRSWAEFLAESRQHGWPSFREAEVVSGNVVVLAGGEVVSRTGAHLGHDLPDSAGIRHCINLVCVAGMPEE